MIYIYDILLNFNDNLVEFFNWNEENNIKYVKKVPIFKVSQKFIKDVVYETIKLDNLFLESIKNECIFYENREKDYNYVALFSDGNIAIGIRFVNNEVNKVSRMLLDEEGEILNICSRIEETKISYETLENQKINRNINLSTKDIDMINKLKEEFSKLYNENKIEKLNYCYYEYFNKICPDKNKVYKELMQSLENINDKHKYIYKIITMSYQKKIKEN